MNPEHAEALRAPFPPSAIGKLPKAGITLDYVGHAAVTARLLDVDPAWSWEPVAYADDGGPMIRYGAKEASLWIKLTVAGVTRLGVGSVAVGAFELEKQLIGDALRNAAMRFGVALDLWARESLHDLTPAPFDPQVDADPAVIHALNARIKGLDAPLVALFAAWKQDQSFPWPWPVVACEQMHAELDRLESAAGSEVLGEHTSEPATPPAYAPGEEPFE